MATEVQVRPGVEADPKALTDIYHHDVRETALTCDTVPSTPERRRPAPGRAPTPEDGPHRPLVAQDVHIVGDGAFTDGARAGRTMTAFPAPEDLVPGPGPFPRTT
ncbi:MULTISPECIES: hypothetical protein [unclassified Streptomyces]|uniref:hypothetical protein n=1 Tax=Streptomyces sp. NPDC055082 TaxID=3365718 RepID=UPI0037D42E4A